MNHQRSAGWFIVCSAALLLLCLPASGLCQDQPDPGSIERISPQEAKEHLDAGEAILVCSYEDRICRRVMIPGAISRDELEEKQASLPEDQELIFYCG